jgi:hypothetical protein
MASICDCDYKSRSKFLTGVSEFLTGVRAAIGGRPSQLKATRTVSFDSC